MLTEVELPPDGPHRATVIWLHGLGADGHDFVPLIPMLGLPERFGVRFRFPEAPVRPVSLNGGMPMRSWFDLSALIVEASDDHGRQLDEEQLRESVARIRELVAAEAAAGIPPERILLAGFSQGGAVALAAAGLDQMPGEPSPVGAVLALSTYVARTDLVLAPRLPGARLFAAHGIADDLIPHRYGEAAFRAFQAAGWGGVFRTYPMGHQVSAVESRDLGRFLRSALGEPA